MAFLLNNSTISSPFRSHSQAHDALSVSRPGFHVEPGPCKKALDKIVAPEGTAGMVELDKISWSYWSFLLAEDPALKRFKSHKKSVGRVKRVPDGLIIGFALCLQVCAVVLMRVVDRNEEEERACWIEKQKREVLE